jgi:hypothetical protein
MKPGDKIKFSFANQEKEGIVYKVFPKTVYLLADFKNQRGKIIRRKIFDLTGDKKNK